MSPPERPPDDGGGVGADGGGAGIDGTRVHARTSPPAPRTSGDAPRVRMPGDAAGSAHGTTANMATHTLSAAIFASPTAPTPTAEGPKTSPKAATAASLSPPDTFAIGVPAPIARGKYGRHPGPRKVKAAAPSSPGAAPTDAQPTAPRSTDEALLQAPQSAHARQPPPAPASVSTTAPPPNVWASAREALLGGGGSPQKTHPPAYDDEVRFAANYSLARRTDYHIMPDGYQRPATPLEDETMLLYKQKKIFLDEPPRFIDEIYPLAVRLVLRQAHHDRMMYDLFVQIPARLKWSAQAAKYHFFENVIRLNQVPPDPPQAKRRGAKSKSPRGSKPQSPSSSPPPPQGSPKGVELFRDVFVFTVSADAHLAVLRFTRPELRDKWLNATFKLPFGTVKLRGTSTFAQDDKRAGLDRTAVKQLYAMELLGHPNMPISDVHAVALALSGGLPILDIKAVQPTGTRALACHVWSVRFYCLDAPKDINQVRCVHVKQGAREFEMGVHLPRNATRHPCVKCLSVDHYPNQCSLKERDNCARAQYERHIEIPATTEINVEPAASDLDGHRQQMLRLHAAVAADIPVAQTDCPASETTAGPSVSSPPQAETPTPSPATPAKPARKGARSSSTKGAQVRALAKAIGVTRASEHSKHQTLAKTLKTRRASGQRADHAAPPPVDKRAKPHAKLLKRGDWSVPSPEKIKVGAKRSVATLLSTTTRSVFTDALDTEPTYEPVTRQAKQTSEHRVVDRSLPDPPRARVEWLPPGGILPPVTRQLTVTSFLTRLGDADRTGLRTTAEHDDKPDSTDEDSVPVLETRPGPPAMTYADLLTTIKARDVRTVADGRCLYDSLRAAQSRTCGDSVDADNPTERSLTKDLMADLNMLLAEDLVPLLAIGSLSLQDLCSRYLQEDDIAADAVPRLIEYFKDAAAQDGPSVARHYWGGEAEITAFVSWTSEPVYVIDVWPDGSAFVQRYAPVDQPFPDGSTATKVIRQGPSTARFIAHIEIYRRQQVVPLILSLRHAFVEGVHAAHFTAVRIRDDEYRHFVGTKRKQEEMKKRLPRVLAEIDDLEQSLTPVPLESEPSDWSSGGCSEYVPTPTSIENPASSPSSDETPTAPASTAVVTEPQSSPAAGGPDNTVKVEDVAQRTLQALGEEQQLPEFDLSQLTATPPDPSIRYDSTAPATTHSQRHPAPLTTPDEILLLEQLRSDDPLDAHHQRLLRKAQKANQTAFRTWQARQQRANPATHRLVADVIDPATATVALAQRPGALSGLYRSLPFPEILLATLADQTLIDIGRAAIVIGRLQMLHRIRSAFEGDIQGMIREWSAAVHATADPDVRWNLAHDESRWQRLNMAASRCGLHLQHRTQPGLTVPDWSRLVAALLLSPEALPHAFVTRELPSRCDALLMWMSNVTNVLDSVAAGSAVARRHWRQAGEVFARWVPALEGQPTHSTPPSRESAPRRY